MQVMKQMTTIIVIYRRNSFPFLELSFKKNIELLQKKYNFEKLDMPIDLTSQNNLLLLFRLNNGFYKEYYIKNLAYEDRKITLNIQSDSDIGGSLLSEIENDISSLSFKPIEQVVKTIRTELYIKLEIDLEKLYSDKILKLLNIINEKDNYIDEISSFGITFKIKYNTPKEMWDENTYFSEKYFRLEREQSTKIQEKRFLSILPLPTKEHIAILKKIEKLFS